MLVHVAGWNKDLLTIAKLLTVFDVYETEADAERSFDRVPESVAV